MKSIFRKIAYFCFCFLLCHCTDSDLPDVFKLDRFRVLALLADQPEVSPGETVMITPLLSDIGGEGRQILFSVLTCMDPGVGVGQTPTCENSNTKTQLINKNPVTGLIAPYYTGLVTSSVSVTVPSQDIVFANATQEMKSNGVSVLVTFDFLFPNGEVFQAFRRIYVSIQENKNVNPSYDQNPILSLGNVLQKVSFQDLLLQVNLLEGSSQTYPVIRNNGSTETVSEQLETYWYISEGDITFSVTDDEQETTFTPPVLNLRSDLVLVTVTMDGRGGTTSCVQILPWDL